MSKAIRRHVTVAGARVFGLEDWVGWFDRMSRSLFGLSGDEFEQAYGRGTIPETGPANTLASLIPFIRQLRERVAREAG